MNLIEKSKLQINEIVAKALSRLVASGEIPNEPLPPFTVEIPANESHGDFSCNAALTSAKALKKPPRAIADLIAKEADLANTAFEKIEIAGPGFINFFAGAQTYRETVSEILKQADGYGKSDLGGNKRVLLEFVSANPTGPMHIGNARGGALGDCLASLLQFAGYYVEREFYVNDAGNQIEKFGLSLDIRYRQELGENVELPEEAYKGEDITERAKEFIKENGDGYLLVGEEERKRALVDFALPKNVKGLEDDLKKYRIVYDDWFRESALHENGEAMKIVEALKARNCVYEKDGALWFKATDYGNDVDVVLVRSNGVPTYIVPDIAYHYNKLEGRKFDMAIDVLGADHHGYVARMNAALSALGVDISRLKVIIMQMVRLVRGGETVKLSKRSGKAITLTTLLDEVPADAARFFFNLREADAHLDFDLDLAIEETSRNPVYYVQYAHARICSIERKLSAEGVSFNENADFVFSHEAEKALIRKLAFFPEEIAEATKGFNPSRITRYIMETAQTFHKFYELCPVKGEDVNVARSRLALVKATGVVIRNALGIMKVTAPEKM